MTRAIDELGRQYVRWHVVREDESGKQLFGTDDAELARVKCVAANSKAMTLKIRTRYVVVEERKWC